MTGINAIVLAGDSGKGFVQEGVSNKSLITINGKPMVEYVIDALRDSSLINKISVSGSSETLKKYLGDKVDYYMEDRNTLFDNIKAGLEPFAHDEAVLVVTSDIPMITGWMITDLVKRCVKQGGDFCYPIVEKKLNEERFPGVDRTYIRLKEGTFTGGNAVYLNPAVIDTCEEFAKKVIAFRKQPLKTGRMLGVKFLAGLMMGRLTIPELEERVSGLLNIKASAVIVSYPEIGNDVDKPSDLEMVMQYFRTQSA